MRVLEEEADLVELRHRERKASYRPQSAQVFVDKSAVDKPHHFGHGFATKN